MAKDTKGFYVLKDENEFDRFVTALLSSIGSALAMDKDRKKEDIDELMDLTYHNIMFLCSEYHGLVSDGKIPPVEQPKEMTREQAREEVLKQLELVEAFFKTASLKAKEMENGKTTEDSKAE